MSLNDANSGATMRFKEKLSVFSFDASSTSALRRSPRKLKTLEIPFPTRSSSTKSRPSPSKRGFAPPEKYSHLNVLQDYLAPNLDSTPLSRVWVTRYNLSFWLGVVVFCGINPGQKSAEIGHHFGGPTNHFWPCLYEAGLTTERLQPTEDYTLPDRFSIGMTNLVDRPTAEQNELSRTEQLASAPYLLSKIAKHKPRIVCFVGLGIAQVVKTHVLPKTKSEKEELVVGYGLQPFKMSHDDEADSETLFFAVASTSGRVVKYQKTHKVEQFKELRAFLHRLKSGEYDTSGLGRIQPSLYVSSK
ncbi:G/T mismatch-specific thymine DNA glycosylase [Leucoagaricus sp. SymC.cos]|nr:G/T mismatch-specific thymine DNA glycosylase [Leucoagaricus sp. SymC.cos]